MKEPDKTLLINIAILMIYLVIINLSNQKARDYAAINVMFFTMIAVFAHAGVNLIIAVIAFIVKKKTRGLHFLLATFTILVIGCFGCFASVFAT